MNFRDYDPAEEKLKQRISAMRATLIRKQATLAKLEHQLKHFEQASPLVQCKGTANTKPWLPVEHRRCQLAAILGSDFCKWHG